MPRILLTICAFVLTLQFYAQDNRGFQRNGLRLNIGQNFYSSSSIQYSSVLENGFTTQSKTFPTISVQIERQTLKKNNHSISIGIHSITRSYQLRAYDIEYFNYPNTIESRKVFYTRHYNLTNLTFGYQFTKSLKRNFNILAGVEWYQPIQFKPKYNIDETIVGYSYSNNNTKESIETHHESFPVKAIEEAIYERLAVITGFQYAVTPRVDLGLIINYKPLGQQIVYDKLDVEVDLNTNQLEYKQRVEMYNRHLMLSLHMNFTIFNF